jgi:hypothetical protein
MQKMLLKDDILNNRGGKEMKTVKLGKTGLMIAERTAQ